MSTLICATTESIATVGLRVKNAEPTSPPSSPVCQMNNVERFGFTGIAAIASAISSTPIEPEPSSSAPLLIESTRATGCTRRMLSMLTLKPWSTSIVGGAMLFASIQRTR